MSKLNLLAFDLGASSGRAIVGRFDGEKLTIEEIHRFSNDPVEINGHIYWDVLRLFWEMKQGILKFVNANGGDLSSVGVDTWGVDFGLLDTKGELLGNPYHYRDAKTEGMFEEAFSRIPREEIYQKTGIAFQKFNTLFQLLSMRKNESPILDKAATLLFMPDLLSYFLCGEKLTEFTEATTSQLVDARTRTWCSDLIEEMGIPKKIFTPIQNPGTLRGKIMPSVCRDVGLKKDVLVVAVGSHDTASAVAAVPALEGEYAYLSSGTWSLMGVEVERPVINQKTLEWNYTNEGGVGGYYCLLKNIMGLWIVQECKREWDRHGRVFSYEELVEAARQSEGFQAFIEPDDDIFYGPGDMPRKVQNYCAKTGQKVPQTAGEIVRCVFESLALKYRWSIERLEEIIGKPIRVLHIVGGGSKNKLLNQFTANAIKKEVVCGPTEATAIGNLMVQAMAMGEVANLGEIRQVIKRSFPTEEYVPRDTDLWDEAYGKFLEVTGLS